MAKIGVLKPFRSSWNGMKDYVLEDGEIAFITEGSKMIYFGDGVNAVKDLTPFADIGGVDISSIGSGSITSAISTLNSNKSYMNGTIGTNWFGVAGYNAETGKTSQLVINTQDNTMLISDGISGHNTLFKLTRN